jgi:hypothetical protein
MMGLSYTKPTYTLAAADEEKQKAFVEITFPGLKKYENGEIDHILFEDESMIPATSKVCSKELSCES